jgi:hypothetical protein
MITLTREEAQQVLDLMTRYRTETPLGHQPHMISHKADEAIEILRARLSAPEPTLVLWNVKSNRLASPSDDRAQVFAIRKLEWQSLTDEEIKQIVGGWGSLPIDGYTRKLFDQIETKLKEKNT